MSIVIPGEPYEESAVPHLTVPLVCFFCSNGITIESIFVVWAGEGDIVLHPNCARKLGVHLISDSREADLAGDEWVSRLTRLVNARMKRSTQL